MNANVEENGIEKKVIEDEILKKASAFKEAFEVWMS